MVDPEAQTELRVRIVALPAALLAAWLLVETGPGHALVRIFIGMWVHESGHAVTAWFCGFHAVPGPWFTPVAESRSLVFAVIVSGAIFALVRYGWQTRRMGMVAVGCSFWVLQFMGTVVLPLRAANALVLFGGDGGCLVLGSALMLTLYAHEESPLRSRQLRFGFLFFGACAFMDVFHTWWAARTDDDVIPFGVIEGVGFSDPSRLVEDHGWSIHALVSRYVLLALFCLGVLALIYVGGIVSQYREVRS